MGSLLFASLLTTSNGVGQFRVTNNRSTLGIATSARPWFLARIRDMRRPNADGFIPDLPESTEFCILPGSKAGDKDSAPGLAAREPSVALHRYGYDFFTIVLTGMRLV